MVKERQGQRPKWLQACVDRDGQGKEEEKEAELASRLSACHRRFLSSPRGLHLFREALRGDGCTNLHPRIQVGLFVAYPEYWLLRTEFRYHQYPSLVRSICYLDRELADSEKRLWNIDGGVSTLLTPEGAPHLHVRLCH